MSDETQVTPDQTIEETTSVAEATPVEEPKVHPAHEKLLAELPEAWHSKVTPYLQEQDKYFQQQLEKYTPFKDYVEQGVSPDLILGGINLARAIETDPQQVFSALKDHLASQGLLPEEAAQAAAEIMEDASEDEEGEIPSALKKELDELKQFKTKQEELQYQQQLEKETEKFTVELEKEMATLKGRYQINEQHEIAIYDIMNAALNAGREISLADAAQQLQGMIGTFQAVGATPAEPAPTIIGSAGGAGIVAPNLTVPKDDKGKQEMLRQMFAQYQQANQ